MLNIVTFKCKLCHSRSLEMALFESLGMVSYLPFIPLTCITSEIKWDIGQKSWFLRTPLHLMPPLGESPLEYCHDVWYRKTRMVGLPDGKEFWGYVQRCPQNICVWRTDRQTDILWQRSPRYAYTSRGKKLADNFYGTPSQPISCADLWSQPR